MSAYKERTCPKCGKYLSPVWYSEDQVKEHIEKCEEGKKE